MPGHADHQATVMPPVGRPPGLAIGHQGFEVVFERRDIQGFERFAIAEIRTHRIRLGILLMQDVQIERLRPPGHDAVTGFSIGTVHYGAFAWGCHTGLLGFYVNKIFL